MSDVLKAKSSRFPGKTKPRRPVVARLVPAFLILVLLWPVYGIQMSRYAWAVCNPCTQCPINDCLAAPINITKQHLQRRPQIKQYITDEFAAQKDWLTTTFLTDYVVPALQDAARSLTVSGMRQVAWIGEFFDAKHQLETQALFQEMEFQAHKDYQPSEEICTFGTAVRSMAHTEQAGRTATLALNQRQMARHLGRKNTGGSDKRAEDKKNRWTHFIQNYCDPQDNNWLSGSTDTGLTSACGTTGGGNSDKVNIDIDYTRLIENRRVLDIYGGAWTGFNTTDEMDIMALGNNLYGHNILTRNLGEKNVKDDEMAHRYLELRSLVAKRGVAENSFNTIVGLKSQGSTGLASNTSDTNLYLGRILMDLGIPQNEVVEYLGLDTGTSYIGNADADASYFATLEILAKKIYQNPNFYANLYDTPTNVKRKSAALKAIELMLDRALHESLMRQEMLMSVLLSSRLKPYVDEANKNLGSN